MTETVEDLSPVVAASRSSWRCVQTGDREGWLALMSDDIVVEDPIGEAVTNPDGTGVRGKEALAAFYDANIMLTRPDAPFKFSHPHRPIFTHARFLPGSRLTECSAKNAIVAEGCRIEQSRIEDSVVGIRTFVQHGATIRRSVLLGADFYESDLAAPPRGDAPQFAI